MGTEDTYNLNKRVVDYGYGLSDIQSARERIGRQDTLGRFNLKKRFQDVARALPGSFNRRGMVDSGLKQRGIERMEGQKEMSFYNLESQTAEANQQLDRQRKLLEESLYGGISSDEVAAALRRFGLASTIQGLV